MQSVRPVQYVAHNRPARLALARLLPANPVLVERVDAAVSALELDPRIEKRCKLLIAPVILQPERKRLVKIGLGRNISPARSSVTAMPLMARSTRPLESLAICGLVLMSCWKLWSVRAKPDAPFFEIARKEIFDLGLTKSFR